MCNIFKQSEVTSSDLCDSYPGWRMGKSSGIRIRTYLRRRAHNKQKRTPPHLPQHGWEDAIPALYARFDDFPAATLTYSFSCDRLTPRLVLLLQRWRVWSVLRKENFHVDSGAEFGNMTVQRQSKTMCNWNPDWTTVSYNSWPNFWIAGNSSQIMIPHNISFLSCALSRCKSIRNDTQAACRLLDAEWDCDDTSCRMPGMALSTGSHLGNPLHFRTCWIPTVKRTVTEGLKPSSAQRKTFIPKSNNRICGTLCLETNFGLLSDSWYYFYYKVEDTEIARIGSLRKSGASTTMIAVPKTPPSKRATTSIVYFHATLNPHLDKMAISSELN